MPDQKFVSPNIDSADALSSKLIAVGLELEASNKRLLESEKARNRILQNISHDLRAPLAAVRGAVDRLVSGTPSKEERKKLLTIIDRRLVSLEKLVDELHLSQRLEQPEFTLKTQVLPISVFLEEYFINLEVSDNFSNRNLSLSLSDNADIVAAIDPDHFIRVLDNLTQNALRHTLDGDSISISQTFNDSHVIINITDTGEGIAPEHLAQIWNRTFTVSTARTPNKTGSGLGLHIVQLIVEKHGGTIECTSNLNEGTTFSISIPRN